MTQVHLEKREFDFIKDILHKNTYYHVLVLDCGVAGFVKYYIIDGIFYYEDTFYTNEHYLNNKLSHYDKENLHAEVYQKLALINQMYC